jgi:hypothetical protein
MMIRQADCSRDVRELRRYSAEYNLRYDVYRRDCAGVKTAPAPARGEDRTPPRRDPEQATLTGS